MSNKNQSTTANTKIKTINDMDISMSKDSESSSNKLADDPYALPADDGGADEPATNTDETWIELRIINRLLNKSQAERDRIIALLNFQHDTNEVEHDFHNDLRQLELKYADRYAKVFHQRSDVIAGRKEPTPAQVESLMFPDLKYMPINNEPENNNVVDERGDGKTVRGIEAFWLEVLKQSVFVDEIKLHDEDALLYLRDVVLTETVDQYTFKFEFDAENPYFYNPTLYKKYFLRNVKSNTTRLDFQGMEIYRTEGTNPRIAWKTGRDLTREETIVKQYNTETNKTRHVKRVEGKDSFFNFFEPPLNELPADSTSSSELADLLHRDFMLGDYLHDCLIPGAVKLYFGIGIADDDADDVDGITGDLTRLNVDDDEENDDDEYENDDEEGSSYEYDDEEAEQQSADDVDDHVEEDVESGRGRN